MWNFSKFDADIAATDECGNISYRQLETEGEALANATGKRCLVFVFCRNTIGALLGYTAFLNNGIVPLLLSDTTDIDLVNSLIEIYKPAYLWLDETLENKFSYAQVYNARGFSLLKTGYAQYPLNEELALLLTTSGSTGSPKLVRQSCKNISANAKSIAQYLELDSTERPITTLPMNYVYGLSIINSHLLVGAAIIMTTHGYMEREFWQAFYEQKATSIAGVPYNYEILKKLRFFRMNLPSLRYMTQAGGKLPPELHKEYAEYAKQNGKRFYVMYGQAEATARMSYLPYSRSLEKYGSMGIAIPGGEFSLIDANQNVITEPDVVGELVYKGDNVTLGYAECGSDLAKGDERGGVLFTGDMAKRDLDGYYYIVGRKKRFLKIFGNRVGLDECEQLIKTEFDTDCACVGVDDKMTVYVTSADTEKITKFISEKTGLNSSAFVVKTASIPKNESGKTLYSELQPRT
jgi:acyl-coenzyme A synthetase/AMP-(fatty) acid ligase